VKIALLVVAATFRGSGIAIITIVIFTAGRLGLGTPLRRWLALLVVPSRLIGMTGLVGAVGWHGKLLS
jgi:hypothetical protein